MLVIFRREKYWTFSWLIFQVNQKRTQHRCVRKTISQANRKRARYSFVWKTISWANQKRARCSCARNSPTNSWKQGTDKQSASSAWEESQEEEHAFQLWVTLKVCLDQECQIGNLHISTLSCFITLWPMVIVVYRIRVSLHQWIENKTSTTIKFLWC